MHGILREKKNIEERDSMGVRLAHFFVSLSKYIACVRALSTMASLTPNFYSRHQPTNERYFLKINFALKSSEKLFLFHDEMMKLHNVENKQNFPRIDDL